MSLPLQGMKVVELSIYVSGPTTGRLFTDWGAEVIKVESYAGDIWRFYGPATKCPATEQENPIFDIYNANKKDILIDLKKDKGREVLFKLLEDADVFITNNRPLALKKMGIDYDSLRDRFPRLVYGLLTGYGQNGPDCDMPGFDGVAFFSRSGLLADSAEPGGYPTSPTGCFGDAATGMALFGGVCAALLARERTGKGDLVEVSLFGNAIWLCAAMATVTQDRYGDPYPKKRYMANPVITYYKCSDGEWINLSILEFERYFKPLCHALDVPELAADPRFADTKSMLKNRAELIEQLELAFLKFSSEEVGKRLRSADVVFDRLRHFRELHKDEQALANDYIRPYTFESGATVPIPMTPIKSRSIGTMPYSRGPWMGEQTDEVLAAAGYSAGEIAKLKEDDVVRQHK